jgi:hypothetical protein
LPPCRSLHGSTEKDNAAASQKGVRRNLNPLLGQTAVPEGAAGAGAGAGAAAGAAAAALAGALRAAFLAFLAGFFAAFLDFLLDFLAGAFLAFFALDAFFAFFFFFAAMSSLHGFCVQHKKTLRVFAPMRERCVRSAPYFLWSMRGQAVSASRSINHDAAGPGGVSLRWTVWKE